MGALLDTNVIRDILANPEGRHWSIQGFGMLRLYLDDCHVQRLHIWDPMAANAEVSTIHDHPWDFSSEIVSGQITNVLYEVTHGPAYRTGYSPAEEYNAAEIKCGEGGGIVGEQYKTWLMRRNPITYYAGEGYSQHAEQLHESHPSRGAVSIITRTFRPNNTDLANVFWRAGDWVTAEPREATSAEVEHFTQLALATWLPAEARLPT